MFFWNIGQNNSVGIPLSVNPFVPNAPKLYPLKTSENLSVYPENIRKPYGFPMFSWGRESVQWELMG